ncbi:hypothetical protein [Vulcanisaeta souniana]|uniref:Uncharacterized protein n=1 Tax=Vulcanisaeta souniana JCM 11219 TaxID=1293586 RepID=A0A830E384_9CREN|nr:hypothetical protein [Vulcanisaeta souniana]BDR93201.1 hypothetical protein Vsou_22940 [Vulcanisaeta souniana JCM 11219]GGI78363.1 hypothetical protein GCM10007112_14020 [Vulcanisaeta souniana JCM 11219]
MMARKSKIITILTLTFIMMLTMVVTSTKVAMACTSPVGGCNYEFTTNGVTPSYVGVQSEITNTMTVESYTSSSTNWLSLQYNPDVSLVLQSNPFGGNWIQAVIAYYVVTNPPGGPLSTVYAYFVLQVWNLWLGLDATLNSACSVNYVINNGNPIPWPLIPGGWQAITYYVGSNGEVSSVYEGLYVPGYGSWGISISISSSCTNHWFRSNVVWAGANGGSVTFYSGGSGVFYYCSNVDLYQGPLADNTAESSNVIYTQMYNQGTTCSMYQDFQT